MISFQTVKSLLFTFSPFLISYALSYYRSFRTQLNANKPSRRPTPPYIQRLLNVLYITAGSWVILTLPLFAPENIFSHSDSKISTPVELLFRRLSTKRPGLTLTPLDEQLRTVLISTHTRSLYLLFGPYPLAECNWCDPETPITYLYYALPSILFPHILNALILGICTSVTFGGHEAARWRLHAVLATLALVIVDIFAHNNTPYQRNMQIFYTSDLIYFHSWFRLARLLGLAALDGALALILWASSTNRLFVRPFTASERVDALGRAMEMTAAKLAAAGVVKNATVRDEGLRTRQSEYWIREGEVMDEVMTSENVSKAVSVALGSGRVSMEKLEAEAKAYAERMVGEVRAEGGMQNGR